MSRDTPAFSLRMKGNPIDEELLQRVTFYEYEDTEGVDKLTVKFDNTDLTIDENEFFDLGNMIETKFGYEDNLSRNRLMIINKILGLKEITVEAFEPVLQFKKPGKAANYENSLLEPIVKKITDGYKLKYNMVERKDINDNPLRADYNQPSGSTDIQFLASIGAKIGYKVWIETDTLFFMPRRYWQPPYMKFIYYGGEGQVIAFVPESFNSDKSSKVNTSDIDIETKQPYRIVEDGSNSKEIRLSGMNNNYEKQTVRKDTKWGSTKIIKAKTKKEAKNKLVGMYNEQMKDQIKAEMPIVGDPDFVSKRVIEVHGVKRYSGKYFVEMVIHTISENGYISKGSLVRNSQFDKGIPKFATNVKKPKFVTNVKKTKINKAKFNKNLDVEFFESERISNITINKIYGR